MEEYLVFARSHPMLMMGLVAIVGLILWTEFSRLTRKYKQVGAAQAVQVMNQDGSLVLDVREDSEVRNGKIEQIHGDHNSDPTEEVKKFVDLWSRKVLPMALQAA